MKGFSSLGREDLVSGAYVGIDNPHFKIHNGEGFVCHYTQTVSDTNDRSIIAFKTPNTMRYPHVTVSASASTAATAFILEAPTITNNTGASLTIFNRRRIGTPTETTVIRTKTNPDELDAMSYMEAT